MSTHHLQLATEPFSAILAGKKTIESRLFDEKRRAIQLGDELIFVNRENESQSVKAKVVGLLRYRSFYDLFNYNDVSLFGGESVEWLENQINQFYDKKSQDEFGVLGIQFELT